MQEDTEFSKYHPLKYPSPWQHCLSQLLQGHPTMYTSFILSYKAPRSCWLPRKGPAILNLPAIKGSGSFSLSKSRGKGENYVIALSHEWFNSSHWFRFLNLLYLQTTWGTIENSLKPFFSVIKMCACATTFETYSILLNFDDSLYRV